MAAADFIHPSERVEYGICDSGSHCVTPGVKRKLNVYWAQGASGCWSPVLATCKGCCRRGRKIRRANPPVPVDSSKVVF